MTNSVCGAAPVVELSGVRVRYPNGAIGVDGVSLRVYPGQVVGLFGANGAGKTTSVRAASGFLRSEGARVVAGRVHVGGRELTNHEPHRFARLGVSIVPEREKVFARLTVTENLLSIGRLPGRDRRRDLFRFIYDLFPVLQERRNEVAGKLSGGQRQMLALARGLLSDPKVLMIDELSLGLHESVQAPLFEAIKKISETGTAVLLVDERMDFAMTMTDYCYVISDGVIIDQGRKGSLGAVTLFDDVLEAEKL